MKPRCITCKEAKCVCVPESRQFESPCVCLVVWLDPERNEEYGVQPCPKARMVSQWEVENLTARLVADGVDASSIKSELAFSGRFEEGYCDQCMGTGYIPFEAWGLYNPSFLVSCYSCDGTGKDDDPPPTLPLSTTPEPGASEPT